MTQPTPLHLTLCSMLPYRMKYYYDGKNIYQGVHDVLPQSIDGIISDPLKKPILRNLSDLDKEIEQDGKRFVPAEVLWSVSENDLDNFRLYKEIPHYWQEMMRHDIKKWDFGDVQMLMKWRFNCFNLPED